MAGYRYPSSCILRVQHELQNMERDPVPFIYVSADESDITSIKALIIGPLDTPYAVSRFFFSASLLKRKALQLLLYDQQLLLTLEYTL